MEEPETITLVFAAGTNLNYRRGRRLEFTEEEIRFFQTYKDKFPSKRVVIDAKSRRAARHKRNEVALAELAAAESSSAAAAAGTTAAAADEQLVPKHPGISTTATGTRPPPVYRGPLLNKDDLGKSPPVYRGPLLNKDDLGTRPPPVYRGPLLNKDDLGKSTETMTHDTELVAAPCPVRQWRDIFEVYDEDVDVAPPLCSNMLTL